MKHTLHYIKTEYQKRGYNFLDLNYYNHKYKHRVQCPKGHITTIKYNDFQQGHGCAICFGTPKRTDEEVRQIYAKENYKCLEPYKNNNHPQKIKCSSNHIYKSRLSSFLNGHRCPYCNKVRILFSDIQRAFSDINYILITTKDEYYGLDGKLEYICDKGHKQYTTWHNFKQGSRCFLCFVQQSRTSLEDIKELLEKEHYKFISCDYRNAKSELYVECPNGHTYKTSWGGFKHGRNRCYKCQTKESKAERDILSYLKEINPNLKVDIHNRDIISPYEIDIYLPDLQIGIEHHGIYWHSSAMEVNKKIHQQKFLLAKQKGIKLIQIFEDEWLYKNDIVKFRLRHILGYNVEHRIYARQCDVRKIPNKLANEFCKLYHIQGKGACNVAYGLFYTTENDKYELCSVMTFSKPNIAKGSKDKHFIELSRFCSSRNVIGGASRLFNAYIKYYNPKEIISFCDLRWGDGRVYKLLGMTLSNITSPNYFYIQGTKRLHRYNFRKDMLIKKYNADINKTELQITKEMGLNRIYDAGNYKFVWTRKD